MFEIWLWERHKYWYILGYMGASMLFQYSESRGVFGTRVPLFCEELFPVGGNGCFSSNFFREPRSDCPRKTPPSIKWLRSMDPILWIQNKLPQSHAFCWAKKHIRATAGQKPTNVITEHMSNQRILGEPQVNMACPTQPVLNQQRTLLQAHQNQYQAENPYQTSLTSQYQDMARRH